MFVNKKIVKIAIVVVGIGLLYGAGELTKFVRYKQKVKATKIENVDISQVADGRYIAKTNFGYVAAEVAVSVENKIITKVEVLHHKHEKGQAAEEKIPKEIVRLQMVDVDIVSGATSSSKAIKKAAELALKKGLE